MRLVVLGLSLSSSWGNGHASTFRGLLKAFAARGHEVLFLERDQPWYAEHRDLPAPQYCQLELYRDLDDLQRFAAEVRAADAVILGSYVPEGIDVGAWVLRNAAGRIALYDIDTPVTLASLERGDCAYFSPQLVGAFDLYLSFTGGPTLERLVTRFGSPMARALYCSVDEEAYRPVLSKSPAYDLGYLGTYSPDRQPTLERLLLEPARLAPDLRFVVAGPLYPAAIAWPANVTRIEHVGPADHPAFYGNCRWTLNVTRQDMIAAGYSPSVRLFEAAACGTPILSDRWNGLETLFATDSEIVLPGSPAEVLSTLQEFPEDARRSIAAAARLRVLQEHTSAHRARELEDHLQGPDSVRFRTKGRPTGPSLLPHCSKPPA